jgi:HPt (histidine-containing phosphotransfer) domain-containing protein
MDICGEHGNDMAYSGRDCPACSQIEDLNKEHSQAIDSLTDERDDMDERIADLQDELEEMREKES